eukprot:CAMPEP_0172531010 /NCGR_PEP_ID=MMETSP1067-20121228/4578_1 /TAXON_ID=265564 ORGANISM="Thalassiosira punctigera, Strain Tpunct2005C2" /NCGR_SAMPLE_ID=MMETSP1067 /ASSEMBLY_ACC=CAM_ASM_000444 /LENGTH=55 /DNA_ID=CAMNT_0013315333 /DNA_START=70 /DNA_END=237 /DNA_ORIENTATION=-
MASCDLSLNTELFGGFGITCKMSNISNMSRTTWNTDALTTGARGLGGEDTGNYAM